MFRFMKTAWLMMAVTIFFVAPVYANQKALLTGGDEAPQATVVSVEEDKCKQLLLESSNEPPTPEAQKEIDETNDAIKRKGLKWKAGVTPLMRIPKEDRHRFMGGVLLSPEEQKKKQRYLIDRYTAEGLDTSELVDGSDFEIFSLTATEQSSPQAVPQSSLTVQEMALNLPIKLDYRNYNGGNYVTPPKVQGCNQCWAYASTALLESKVLLDLNLPGTDLDLSERLLVSCTSVYCAGGTAVKDFFVNTGLPTEQYAPASAQASCSSAVPGWQLDTYKISGYQNVPIGVEGLKAALYNYGPLYVSMTAFYEFAQHREGIYSWSGRPMGTYDHALELIGYDDEDSCFIVKNSDGTYWGEGGFGRIAYSEVFSFNYAVAYSGAFKVNTGGSLILAPANGTVGKETHYTVSGVAKPGLGTTVREVQVSTDGGVNWSRATDTSVDASWKTWSYEWLLPANGTFTIISKEIDATGVEETPRPGVTIKTDNIPPRTLSLYYAVPPSYYMVGLLNGAVIDGNNIHLYGTVSDSSSGLGSASVSTDGGGNWGTATLDYTHYHYYWTPPARGTYQIKTRIADKAGNVETPDYSATVTVTWPTSTLTAPLNGAIVNGSNVVISGTALVDTTGYGVQQVEVSTDNGATWQLATGTDNWTYNWTLPAVETGTHRILTRATDIAGHLERVGAGVDVIVNNPFEITSPAFLQNVLGEPLNLQLTVAGGVAPYVWTIAPESLPVWLTLNGSTGVISGTPPEIGTSCFTVQVEDSSEHVTSREVCLEVIKLNPDLIGTTIQVDRTSITTDQLLMITARIKNQGPVAATGVGVSVYLSTDNVITTSDINLGMLQDWTRYRDVGAGGETTITGGIYMPQAPSGQYYIGIIVDAENLVPESDEANNGLAAGTQLTNTGLYQDLVVTALTADRVNYLRGQGITASYSYKNQGQYVAKNDFNVRFYLSRDNVITPDDYYEEYLWDYNLAAGAEKAGTKALPTNYNEGYLPDGFYYLGMIADVSNTNVESDETNNAFVGTRIYLGSDTTPPTGSISINSGAVSTSNPAVTLALSATDAQSGVTQMQFSNDNVTWTTVEEYAATKSWTLLSGDGSKTVYVKYKDFVGNWSTAYAATITLDNLPPVVTISSPATVATNDNTPLLTYTVNEPGAIVVKLDGNVVSKASGDSLNTLTDGQHTVTVLATDAAGNVGSASVTFNVDTIPPVVTTTAPTTGTTNDNTPLLAYSVSDGAVVVKVDNVVVSKVSGDSLNTLSDGQHTVTVQATDAAGNVGTASVTFTVSTIPVNLALNKTANASSVRSSTTYPASKAVDGSTSSSWMSSSTSSAQWVRVDLGSSQSISYIKVVWPATYYAKAFRIETSTDGSSWTQRYSSTTGNGSTTTASFTAVNARYVRVYCTTYNNSSYYGVAEIEVYTAAPPNQPPTFAANPITKPNATVGVAYSGQTLSGSATDPDGDAITYSKVSGPSWLTVASNGALSGTPSSIASDSFVVRATSTGGTADVTLNITVVVAPPVNLALNKSTSVSSTRSSTYAASKAVDGSTGSSWMSSGTSSAQWVRVDLGSSQSISNVKVSWPATYYARAFRIETSTDGSTWTQRYTTTSGNGAQTDAVFTTVNARYVRVYCTTPNNSSYYGVAEVEVYQ